MNGNTMLVLGILSCSSSTSVSWSWQRRREQRTAAAGLPRGRYELGVVGLMSCCQSSPGKRCTCHSCRDSLAHAWLHTQGWSGSEDTMRAKDGLRRPLTTELLGQSTALVSSVLREPLSCLNEGDNILQDGSVRSQR